MQRIVVDVSLPSDDLNVVPVTDVRKISNPNPVFIFPTTWIPFPKKEKAVIIKAT